MKVSADIENLKYDAKGLIPAIVQDAATRVVLMQGYMNAESLQKTLETGKACFFSRSRGRLWTKGEESGHFLPGAGHPLGLRRGQPAGQGDSRRPYLPHG